MELVGPFLFFFFAYRTLQDKTCGLGVGGVGGIPFLTPPPVWNFFRQPPALNIAETPFFYRQEIVTKSIHLNIHKVSTAVQLF